MKMKMSMTTTEAYDLYRKIFVDSKVTHKEEKMALYEVAIIESIEKVTSTSKGATTETEERLVFGPKAVCATDEKSAVASATIGETIPGEKSKFTVLVRPFK